MCALIGNLQLANPIIRIQQAFHNTKYLQDCKIASDPYKSERRPLYQTNIEMLISKWCHNGISNWACRRENEKYQYIRQLMVDVVSAAEFHRPDNRTVDVLACRRFDLSTFLFVDVVVCRRFGLSTFWFVYVLVCRRFGLSTFWFVDVSVCRRFGLSTFCFVDFSVCRRFDQLPKEQ